MRRALLILLCLNLGACTATEQNFAKAMKLFKDNQKRSNDALVRFFGPAELDGTDKFKAPSPEPRFCYKTSSDILCYREPQEGEENRLVSTNPPGIANRYQAATSQYSEAAAVPLVSSKVLESPFIGKEAIAKEIPDQSAWKTSAKTASTASGGAVQAGPKQLLKNF